MLHGEIHNTAALARELGLPAAATAADVVAAGWQRESAQFIPRLDGVYALAIHDDEGLHLHRDHSGLRNLYFHNDAAGVASYGADLAGLVRQPGVPRRLARPALHEYLRFGDISAPRTVYEGVRAVEPGQLVSISSRGERSQEIPRLATDGASAGDFAAVLDHLANVLDRSVEARLAGSQRPAAFLSGGIDSSLLAALAGRQRPDLTTVTVGFENPTFDESGAAASIAAHLGLRHAVLRFGLRDCLAALVRLARDAEQPLADPTTAVTVLAFDHCRTTFDAVLDGTGADEAVGLMPPRHIRVAVGYAGALPAPLRVGLTRLMRTMPGFGAYAPVTDFEHPADTMIRWRGFARPEIVALCGEPVSFEQTRFYRTFHRYPRHAHFERYSALLDAMPSERLSQAMRVSDLAVRYPYCSPSVDGYIRGLPVEHRWQPGEPKRVLRRLLARYVPARLWDGPKHGFDFPLRSFLAADDHALVRRYLDAGLWASSRILAPERVRQYGSRFMAGEAQLAFRVWMLVLLGAWLDEHDEHC
jgi:asparagine synthase (glutamine-hydrolysing)